MSTATRSTRRLPLPAAGDSFITDAGLETELVFSDGIDLPHFAAAVLLEHADGRARLRRYFQGFIALAQRNDRGVLFETPTWRLNRDWAERLGYDRADRARLNHAAVDLLQDLRHAAELPDGRFLISGNLGPRYDGYRADVRMTPAVAADYHAEQIDDLAAAGADLITAMTITTPGEAEGIALAAAAQDIPAVIMFTLETDGRLPSGGELQEAIEQVDARAPGAVAWFGINCAHPSHFIARLRAGGDWLRRLGSIRANASTKSHAELDASTALDAGDVQQLARLYAELREILPELRVLGGCCGTDLGHIQAICHRCPR